ncbi:MAG: glutamate synthase-related protein [Flavobacteriales bacterium]|nr:glutamate synthase-related protein [Flavobacteriales bacterium]
MNLKPIIKLSQIEDRIPKHGLVSDIDLVIIKYDNNFSILYGRCLHRGALMADGHIEGANLICGVHGWDYRYDTGVSEYNNKEVLHKFSAHVDGENLCVDLDEINKFKEENPPAFDREAYQGAYADTHPEETEPYTLYIKELAANGLKNVGHHGFTSSMGVDRNKLPKWEEIQFLPAQMANKPLLDDDEVSTKVIIGPKAKNPLQLDIPIFVSDMSFGALSREAKIALSKGAELAGTGICSGEGGMLPDEKAENSKYLYELASAKFGFSWDKLESIQAFHFKGGQGAKTGTGGHLPGNKVKGEIAKVRGLKEGVSAISPATFTDSNLQTASDFRNFGNKVREISGGVPIGFKLAASHLEKDLAFALEADADYIILDGRGGGTGAAPDVLKNNINVPTIPALARARKFLDDQGVKDVTLIITGGLRIADDFAKALMLGADAVAVSNSALQAIGCLGMRACSTNNCPVGIATQKESLRNRIEINVAAQRLARFFGASNDLIKVIARACGYNNIEKFNKDDLSTLNREMYYLTGINYAGFIK